MNYSVNPEIKHKPKEVKEKFMVWEAGGRVLAITTKDDAELIVHALNYDELFEEIEEFFERTGSPTSDTCFNPLFGQTCGKCIFCTCRTILAKIKKIKETTNV